MRRHRDARGRRQDRNRGNEETRPPADDAVPREPGRRQEEQRRRNPRERERRSTPLATAREAEKPDDREDDEREVEDDPFVRADQEAPEAVEERMREARAAVRRQRTAEADDLERQPDAERRGGSARERESSLPPRRRGE